MNLSFLQRAALAAVLSMPFMADAVAAEPRYTRAQALEHLSDTDVAKRRAAAARLGDVGQMTDAKALVDELRDADEEVRNVSEEALWKIWERSGDRNVHTLYRRGVREMSDGALDAAVATFTRVIRMKPAFAEAWNKRATVYFLAGEYDKSLADCQEVMKRNPYHFGALSGYFQIYVELEEYELAVKYGRRALSINPNMEGVRKGVESIEQMLGKTRTVI